MKGASSVKEKILLALGIISLLYYIACGIVGGFKISALWVWLIAGVGFGAAGLGWLDGFWALLPGFLRAAAAVAAFLFLAAFVLVEGKVLSRMSAAGEADLDYIVVLGAAVKGTKPGQALRLRLERAHRYLEENPGTVAILSGGRGPGEEISEADCMERELVRMGISPDRIVKEDRSASTVENIRYSYGLIPEPSARVGILTNNFHLYRATAIAGKQGDYAVCGIAAPYTGILLPHSMVREFMTVVVDKLRGSM